MMKQLTWKQYLFWILLAEGVGALAGFLSREGTKLYNAAITQPPLSPPAIVFPIVWSLLYALMGISAARISAAPASEERSWALGLFFVQLAFNFLWSILFFNFQAFALSFFWLVALWILILGMLLAFRPIDPLSAWLQLPYLLWVTFAGYLNYGVWMLNP